jgi:hypothetical protein
MLNQWLVQWWLRERSDALLALDPQICLAGRPLKLVLWILEPSLHFVDRNLERTTATKVTKFSHWMPLQELCKLPVAGGGGL